MVGLWNFAKFWSLIEKRWDLSLWCMMHRNLPGGCWHLHWHEPGQWEPGDTPEVGGFKASILKEFTLEYPGQVREGRLTRIIDL